MYQSYAGDGRKRHSHIVLGIMFATGIYVLFCEFLGDKIAVARSSRSKIRGGNCNVRSGALVPTLRCIASVHSEHICRLFETRVATVRC